MEPVAVVLIHWNQAERCLASLARFGAQGVPVRAVIVDNASAPEQLAVLRTGLAAATGEFDRAPRLLEQRQNLGWGPGANVGLRGWLDETASTAWVAIAPHDALPADDCLARMLAEGARRPRAGLVSADVGDGASTVIDPYFGSILRSASVTDGWEPVDYPHGTLLLARRACLEEIGIFDERYFAYCDEADLGERARRAGWEVGLVRGAMVRNPAVGGSEAVVDYLEERNTLLLVRSHFGRYAGCVRLAMSLVQLALGLVAPGRRRPGFNGAARWRAVCDHLAERYGPPPNSLR